MAKRYIVYFARYLSLNFNLTSELQKDVSELISWMGRFVTRTKVGFHRTITHFQSSSRWYNQADTTKMAICTNLLWLVLYYKTNTAFVQSTKNIVRAI